MQLNFGDKIMQAGSGTGTDTDTDLLYPQHGAFYQ
jgi:hypothetical protein